MKIVYIILGFISLGLGIVGILLPVLPTTPFLLLTVAMFTKGSDRVSNWFKGTNIYIKYLKEFDETHTMTKNKKRFLSIFTDILLLVSIMKVEPMILKVVIILLIIIKHYYFYKYIGIREEV